MAKEDLMFNLETRQQEKFWLEREIDREEKLASGKAEAIKKAKQLLKKRELNFKPKKDSQEASRD